MRTMGPRKLGFFLQAEKKKVVLLSLALLLLQRQANPLFEEAQNDGMMIHECFVLCVCEGIDVYFNLQI